MSANFSAPMMAALTTPTSKMHVRHPFRAYAKIVWNCTELDPAFGKISICTQKNGGIFGGKVVPLDAATLIEKIARHTANSEHVWNSVGIINPDVESGRGTRADVIELRALFADIDLDNGAGREAHKPADGALPLPTAEQVVEMLAGIAGFGLPIGMVVDTGNGVHVYVPLEGIDPRSGNGQEVIARWKHLVNSAAAAMGVHIDKGVAGDYAHVMRTPGGRNFKTPVAPEVEIIFADPAARRLTEAELLDILPPIPAKTKAVRRPRGERTAVKAKEMPAKVVNPEDWRPRYRFLKPGSYRWLRTVHPAPFLAMLGWDEAGGHLDEERWTRPNSTTGDPSATVRLDDRQADEFVVGVFSRVCHGDWGLIEHRVGDHSPVVLSVPDLITVAFLEGDRILAARLFAAFDNDPDGLAQWITSHASTVGLEGIPDAVRGLQWIDHEPDLSSAPDQEREAHQWTDSQPAGNATTAPAPVSAFRMMIQARAGMVAVPTIHKMILRISTPGETGTFRIKNVKVKGDDGGVSWEEEEQQTNNCVMWRARVRKVVGCPDLDRWTVGVARTMPSGKVRVDYVGELTTAESLDPAKIMEKLPAGAGVYVDRRSLGYEDMRACLALVGTEDVETETAFARMGWHDLPEGAAMVSGRCTITAGGLDRTRFAEHPIPNHPAAKSTGWDEVSTNLRSDAVAIRKMIARHPDRPHIAVASIGASLCSFGAAGGTVVHMVGIPASGKTLTSVASLALQMVQPSDKKAAFDISGSSEAGAGAALPFFTDFAPLGDDANEARAGSRKKGQSAETLTAVIRAVYNGTPVAKAESNGQLSKRLIVRCSALTSGELAILDVSGTTSRYLPFSLTREDTDWDAHNEFMTYWAAAANRLGASLVQWIARQIDSHGKLAPGGTIESLSATTRRRFTQLADKHVADGRSAEAVARVQFGWELLYAFAEDAGFVDVLPAWSWIEEQLDVLRGHAKNANKNASIQEQMAEAIANELASFNCYIGSERGDCPDLGVKPSPAEMKALGWRYKADVGWWVSPQAKMLGWLFDDGKTIIINHGVLKQLVKNPAKGLPFDDSIIPDAMSRLADPFWEVAETLKADRRNTYRTPAKLFGKGRRISGWPFPARRIGVGPEKDLAHDQASVDQPDVMTVPVPEPGCEWMQVPSDPQELALACGLIAAAFTAPPAGPLPLVPYLDAEMIAEQRHARMLKELGDTA